MSEQKLVTGERIVRESRARSTGTVVLLVDGRDRGEGWETICDAHGGVCSHGTRRLAESFMAAPEEWCEDCMYGPGTLSGEHEVPGLPGSDRREEPLVARPLAAEGSSGRYPRRPNHDKEEGTMARNRRSQGSTEPQPENEAEVKPEAPATIGLFNTLLEQAKAVAAEKAKAAQVEKAAYTRVDMIVGEKRRTLVYLNNPSSKSVRVETPKKGGGGYDPVKVATEKDIPKAMKNIEAVAERILSEATKEAQPATA